MYPGDSWGAYLADIAHAIALVSDHLEHHGAGNSGAWERTETVRKSHGQTVATVQAKPGLRGSTLATLSRMELIKVG
jgi:hypothetical protein